MDDGLEAIVFDVNETLIDITHLTPLFARIFGDGRVMREWFAQLVLYSEALTLAGTYLTFGEIGGGVMRMLGAIHGVPVETRDLEDLRADMGAMPAHADVAPALARLQAAGFRLATLTNSAPAPGGGPLRRAGLEAFFEQRLSVHTVRRFKPAPETYASAAAALDLPPARICLVAAHVWDTLGAQAYGMQAGLVLRDGNAELVLDGLPPATLVAPDLTRLTDQIIARWAKPEAAQAN